MQLEITGSTFHDRHEVTVLIEVHVIAAGFVLETITSGSKLDAVLAIGEVFNNCVTSAFLNEEGVTTAMPPDVVYPTTTNQEIVTISTQKLVITLATNYEIVAFTTEELVTAPTAT